MNRRLFVAATAASAVATIGVQILALVALGPADYGYFSILYLAGAFALSVHLSLVSEAWVRSIDPSALTDWRSYASATVYVGACCAIIPSLIAALIPALSNVWWLAALAVFASVYRSGARFHSMRTKDWPGVLRGDVLSAVVAVVGAVAIFLADGGVEAVVGLWALVSLTGAAASRLVRPTGPGILGKWLHGNRRAIRVLLPDSLIMDLSSIGTPYALAPILGVADFGVYRGVSNVSAPVRLVLNPLRPQVASLPHARLTRGRSAALFATVSTGVGAAAAGALLLLRSYYPHLGTLTHLADYAVPTGLFVAANMFGHGYYLVARNHAAARAIWRGRLVQTVLTTVVPISAALAGGLQAAIWAYALSTAASALSWYLSSRDQDGPRVGTAD